MRAKRNSVNGAWQFGSGSPLLPVALPEFDPADGESTNDADTNITLTFAEAIKKDSSNGDFAGHSDLAQFLRIQKNDLNGEILAYTASIDSEKKVITIDPTASLEEGAVYVSITSNYYNALGTKGRVASATFTVDTTAPSPTFSPGNGKATNDVAGNITLTFAEAIRKDAAGAEFTNDDLAGILTLKTTDDQGTPITYSATINDAKTVITIDPDSDLAEGAVYVAISSGYFDKAGNRGDATNATFTIDTTGVSSPTFSPGDGEATKDVSANITLTFDEAVKRSDGADFSTEAHLKEILTLKKDNSGGANIAYTASIDGAKKVIAIDPTSDLEEGAVYVAISAGYYDGLGNSSAAASVTFTVDTTAPSPTFSPADGTATKEASDNITLTFGEAIRKDASGTDFGTSELSSILTLKTTNAQGNAIGYSATINTEKTVITLDPDSDLSEGAVFVCDQQCLL